MAKKRARNQPSAAAVAVPDSKRETTSIRKIANGWLIRKSKDGPGRLTETETFSAKKPKITVL